MGSLYRAVIKVWRLYMTPIYCDLFKCIPTRHPNWCRGALFDSIKQRKEKPRHEDGAFISRGWQRLSRLPTCVGYFTRTIFLLAVYLPLVIR